MSCCGNNPWAPSGPSTQGVCGNFDEPENPDLGQCSPYREKRTCDAPSPIQRGPCPTEAPVAEANPGGTPPFRILTQLFDENCELILDENNLPILTYIN